jgi:hypothetical protein
VDNLEEKVRGWLERTGFPLEMRVAEIARTAGPLWVSQSRDYVDPSTGTVRETDVVVAWRDRESPGARFVYLVLECKAKPAPWVIFDDGGLPTDDAEGRLGWSVMRTALDRFERPKRPSVRSDAFVGGTLLAPSRVGYGVAEADFRDGRTGERNPAWDAVRSAVSAAHGVLAEFDSSQIQQGNIVMLACPVVVTSGRLFRAFLRDGELMVEEVPRGEVLIRHSQELDATRCLVVTEGDLPKLFAQAAATPALLRVSE